MSQSVSQSPVRQTHHILIIDDSARLRLALADMIAGNCLAAGKPYRVFHCDKDGKFVPGSENTCPVLKTGPVTNDPARLDEFAVYTAPSPKHALFVINSPIFTQLTIISDVMMPADTEVGLIGMLDAIAKRNLLVNLVFASSDAQNRFVVQKLVESNKAYFVVKSAKVWEELSQALVHRTASFQFKRINGADYSGVQSAANQALHNSTAASFGEEILNPHIPTQNTNTPGPRPGQVASAPVQNVTTPPPRPPLPDMNQFQPASQGQAKAAPPRPPLPDFAPVTPASSVYRSPAPAQTAQQTLQPGPVSQPVKQNSNQNEGFVLFRPFKALVRAFKGGKSA
ncbi:MAG TPA: hypothetical protein VH186_18005 [Chloroflexia bacterium]|nr:hypothetical protein [Chloroflexia bacterium]